MLATQIRAILLQAYVVPLMDQVVAMTGMPVTSIPVIKRLVVYTSMSMMERNVTITMPAPWEMRV
jgi:hypothetical protein